MVLGFVVLVLLNAFYESKVRKQASAWDLEKASIERIMLIWWRILPLAKKSASMASRIGLSAKRMSICRSPIGSILVKLR